MVLTYKECIERFGTDYKIKKELASGNLFQKEKGLYSDKKLCSELEIIIAKYPRAILTGESAYYYYGLTDDIPDTYSLATRRSDTRIHKKNIRQYFIKDNLFDIGKSTLLYENMTLPIFSRERLLVDLIRSKSKLPFDYYKEVIGNYRRIADELDFFAIEDYANLFKNNKKIMDAIQLEVL
jgi:predicted transcriptional regulator of viral defense system